MISLDVLRLFVAVAGNGGIAAGARLTDISLRGDNKDGRRRRRFYPPVRGLACRSASRMVSQRVQPKKRARCRTVTLPTSRLYAT
jgi:hypothetical protein